MDDQKELLLPGRAGHFNDHLNDESSALVVEALLQGKMSAVPEDVLSHVEACRECKDSIMEMVAFRGNPDSAGQLKEKLSKRAKARQDWQFYRGKIAAVFIAAAVLVGAYFFISDNPQLLDWLKSGSRTTNGVQKNQPLINPANTESTQPGSHTGEKKLFPGTDNMSNGMSEKTKPAESKPKNGHAQVSRFQVNPNLENMTGSRLRSGGFEVLSPDNGSILQFPIHFSWKKDLSEPHSLKIVDNKNSVLYTYSVKGTSFDFNESLPRGLYYWKLESQNELLYVGKFFIGGSEVHR